MLDLMKKYGSELVLIIVVLLSSIFTAGTFYQKTENLRSDVDAVETCHIQDYKENSRDHQAINERIHLLEIKIAEVDVKLAGIESKIDQQDDKLDRILLTLSGYDFQEEGK